MPNLRTGHPSFAQSACKKGAWAALSCLSVTCPGTVYESVGWWHMPSCIPDVSCPPRMGVRLVLYVQQYLWSLMGCEVGTNY